MAIQSDKRTIGEHTYRVTQLTALKGRALFTRLVRFLGPAAAGALGSRRGLGALDKGALMSDLATRVTDEELGYFCDVLGECTEIIGASGKAERLDRELFDVHFAGRMLDMFKWLQFALEVNFADFLSVLRRIPDASSTAPAMPQSPSPPASTGTSIAS